VPQGDFVLDESLPDDACGAIIQEVQNANPKLYYVLIHSERIDLDDNLDECVDGASVAGCFSCIFECK